MNKTELIIRLTVEYALDGEEPEVAHQMAIDSVESIAELIESTEMDYCGVFCTLIS